MIFWLLVWQIDRGQIAADLLISEKDQTNSHRHGFGFSFSLSLCVFLSSSPLLSLSLFCNSIVCLLGGCWSWININFVFNKSSLQTVPLPCSLSLCLQSWQEWAQPWCSQNSPRLFLILLLVWKEQILDYYYIAISRSGNGARRRMFCWKGVLWNFFFLGFFSAIKPVDTDDILKLSSECRYLLWIVRCMFLSKANLFTATVIEIVRP